MTQLYSLNLNKFNRILTVLFFNQTRAHHIHQAILSNKVKKAKNSKFLTFPIAGFDCFHLQLQLVFPINNKLINIENFFNSKTIE
jgi:hypothetical protein